MASAGGGGGSSIESGILRKRSKFSPENQAELLVFGYQCHLFRDDEKAQFIDQGKHLIPWMNDNTIKIDRYDVRATLSDLKVYEPPPGGYTNRLDYLSSAEQKAEQLCEEERYYSLYHNEREEEYQQEEELKRLQSSSYAQVGFNYDAPSGPAPAPEKQSSVEEEDEEVFVPSPNFPIPSDIELPPTVKLNAIIEKTAKFIATQGTQMEILIKTKQANNPQFDFLNQNGRFNRYYKYILVAIKENRYPNVAEVEDKKVAEHVEKKSTADHEDQTALENDSQYSFGYQNQKPYPVLKYKPSADCSYTQLVSKITGAPLPVQTGDQSYVEIQEEQNDPSVNGTTTPQLPETEKVEFKRKADSVEVKKISTGLMLAQCYNSDSESDEDSNSQNSLFKLDLPIPPEGLQHIIDKTAAYVAKNGKDFEDILRTKQDPRFSFLDESSEFHRYYIYKVTGSIYLPSSVNNGESHTKEETTALPTNSTELATKDDDDDKPKVVTPVCFSIKAKDDPQVAMKPALPQEPSSDEEITEQNGTEDIKEICPEPPKILDSSTDLSISVEELLELEEKKEAKRAEEKVRDKLAAAAREKLGLISKEKQLQQERKKKAMAFLTQIKSSGLAKSSNVTPTSTGSEGVQQQITTPKSTIVGNGQKENNTDSDASIHSLPTTTTTTTIVNLPDTNREKSHSRSRSRKRRIRSRSRSPSTSRSRSRSRSPRRRRSSSVKRKKKKSRHEHSKKKSKRKSRSRSGSREKKHKKKSRKRSEERHRLD